MGIGKQLITIGLLVSHRFLCRLLEKVVRDAIVLHCMNNSVFFESQFGFRDRRMCTLQLLKVLDEWTNTVDNGLQVDTLYLDLQKAFDSVPHK